MYDDFLLSEIGESRLSPKKGGTCAARVIFVNLSQTGRPSTIQMASIAMYAPSTMM